MNTKKTQIPLPVEYINNWERDVYITPSKLEFTNIKEVLIFGKLYKVKSRPVSVSYDDMGHRYTATSTHYFVEERVFGKNFEFDLNTVAPIVKVVATKYKLDDPIEL